MCLCILACFLSWAGNKEPHRLASVNTGNTNHIHNLHLSLHDRTCSELFITSPFKKSTYYWALHWYIGCQTKPVSPNKWLFLLPANPGANSQMKAFRIKLYWRYDMFLKFSCGWVSCFTLKYHAYLMINSARQRGLNIDSVLFLAGLSDIELYWGDLYNLNISKDTLTWPTDVFVWSSSSYRSQEGVCENSDILCHGGFSFGKMPSCFFQIHYY